MKTALSMAALVVLLAAGCESSSVAEQAKVTTSAKPTTRLYVHTIPEGAEIRLAGESKGRSPQLIPVPDRATTMTVEVELDGYGQQQREVKIEGGRIMRVEFRFDQGRQERAKPATARLRERHFVCLVVGKDRMTFEGKDAPWEKLPELLQKVPHREDTVLWIARAPGKLSLKQWDEAMARAVGLVQEFGFEYLSDVGERPLGAKGGPPEALHANRATSAPLPHAHSLPRSIWHRVMNPPEGWKVRESFIVPRDQTAVIEKKLGGRIKTLSNTVFSARGQRVQVNVIEGRTSADAEKIHKAVLAMKGDPAYALRFDNTIVEFVGTFDVAFAKRAARELGLLPSPKRRRPPSFGPVFERVVNDHRVGKDYLIDLDTGKLYTRPANLNILEEMHAWARKQGIDASGVKASEGVLAGFEIGAAIVDGASWEGVTPQAVREALKQPDPRLIVRQGDAPPMVCLGGKGVSPEWVYAFETREGGVGVLQLVGPGDKDHRSVKIRYKLVQQTLPQAQRQRHFVRLVVGKDRMTFEGKDATWEELPGLLQKVPNRKQTVLEIAVASDEVTLKEKNNAIGRASMRARQFGFESLSYIGVHPLGSKGSPPQTVPQATNEEAIKKMISNFVEAATRDDKASVAKFLYKRSYHILEQISDMRQAISGGLNPAKISLVVVGHGRALAVTDFAQVQDPKYKGVMCVVYIVVKQADRWVIEDIDLEDVKGLSDEIRRLQTEPDQDESTQPSKKVYLPDADTPGAEVVLDLASGETLKAAPNGKEALAQFTRLGKGDLLYNRALGCLRGAKAMRWDGKRFVPLPGKRPNQIPLPGRRLYQLEDKYKLLVYKLPETPWIPCRLLITTAEAKHFDVTVLSITDKGGINLEYREADPAVVPEKAAATQKEPPKKVHLPDADTRGAATVLDLASGEIFPFPEIDGPPDLLVFTRLGKGDLFFDRMLGCARGTKAMRWDGKRFVTFPPKEQIEDASAYELPALPCRLLITTAEKKHFDVTILARTKHDGGIDLEYRPADPSVLPSIIPPRKVHLPNLEGGPGAKLGDFRRLKGFLDLASGQTLAIPDHLIEKGKDAMEFSTGGEKSDLFYAGGSLFCLRGAKAMRWDGKQFSAMEEGDFAPSSKDIPKGLVRYELHKLPCRLLITTAENRHFDVTILARTKHDGGINLEYQPADPAVVPQKSRARGPQ